MVIDTYWIILAIIKIVVTAFIVIIQAYYKFPGNYYPIVTTIVAALFAISYAIIFEDFKTIKDLNYLILILFGFFLFLFIFLSYKLLISAPHPGYFKILSIYELLLIIFISYYFYNAEITLRNWLGFILIIVGTTFLINF
jgi:multidrug transporter EmrE-like cation transporter